jgi:hypothetical protein
MEMRGKSVLIDFAFLSKMRITLKLYKTIANWEYCGINNMQNIDENGKKSTAVKTIQNSNRRRGNEKDIGCDGFGRSSDGDDGGSGVCRW